MNTSILVVDDDDAHRGMLRMMLQAWGYSVDEAADGDLAVEAVRAKPYDVVLTDVRIGRMDGIHALRGILDYNPALPVVLMTAYSSVETAVDALRLGAYDYLTKPLDFDALRETLQRAVDHSRMSVENRELRRQIERLRKPAGSSVFAADTDGDIVEIERSRRARMWRRQIQVNARQLPSRESMESAPVAADAYDTPNGGAARENEGVRRDKPASDPVSRSIVLWGID